MTGFAASKLANEYRHRVQFEGLDAQRAKEILVILRENGWKRLAELLEHEQEKT